MRNLYVFLPLAHESGICCPSRPRARASSRRQMHFRFRTQHLRAKERRIHVDFYLCMCVCVRHACLLATGTAANLNAAASHTQTYAYFSQFICIQAGYLGLCAHECLCSPVRVVEPLNHFSSSFARESIIRAHAFAACL